MGIVLRATGSTIELRQMLTAKINDKKLHVGEATFVSIVITLEFMKLGILTDIIRKKNAIVVKLFFVSCRKTTM